MNILVVDDEKRLADSIGEIFRSQKYYCDCVYDGEDGLSYAEYGIYDVIVLDIMLPKLSGFEVLKALRAKKISTPVILLTARDEVSDKVKGLDYGADDYLTKPFSKDELLARVRALSRRTGDVIIDVLEYGDLKLDLNSNDLSRGDRKIHLGYKEFEILKLLMANPSQVFSKEDLITKVWGFLSEAEDNNVEVY
ncbi:MAG: response regulator transcription factor, partial [Clostridia bacterium]|nr:response regulator transcription factor [Clostridia bacterium]